MNYGSYLMKFTSSGFGLPEGGLRKSLGSLASQYRFVLAFPRALQSSTCLGSHVSKLQDRTWIAPRQIWPMRRRKKNQPTWLMCTPRDRCTPEQERHMKQPKFAEALDHMVNE